MLNMEKDFLWEKFYENFCFMKNNIFITKNCRKAAEKIEPK
jgi:hypothetical protein